VTPTISQATREAAGVLERAGVPDARREASSLLSHILAQGRAYLFAHPEENLNDEQARQFLDAVGRRAGGEPFQYITGRQEFYGLEFEVNHDVLIPRPETENLVEVALELLESGDGSCRICDVGTGSGCIAVSILSDRPETRAIATDISLPALRVAARNIKRHGLEERIALVASDCLAAIDEGRPEFRMIVSNPPYVSEDSLVGLQREVRDHEPRVALTPGGDGLGVIRRLLDKSHPVLISGGYLLFEIGFDQQTAVKEMIDQSAWDLLEIRNDLQGIPRTVALKKRQLSKS
jgi:release factor glutamine methyltransferase